MFDQPNTEGVVMTAAHEDYTDGYDNMVTYDNVPAWRYSPGSADESITSVTVMPDGYTLRLDTHQPGSTFFTYMATQLQVVDYSGLD